MDGENNEKAVLMFNDVLKYMLESDDPAEKVPQKDVAGRIIEDCLRAAILKDELYMQLMKQTRNNPNLTSKLRLWELWLVLAASAPPSKVH